MKPVAPRWMISCARHINSQYLSFCSNATAEIVKRCGTLAQRLLILLSLGTLGYGIWEVHARPDDDDGLYVTWFSKANFRGHPFMWTTRQLTFDWRTHPPVRIKQKKQFSALWQGCIHVAEPGLRLRADIALAPFYVNIDDKRVLTFDTDTPPVDSEPGAVAGKFASHRSQTSATLTPGIHRIEMVAPRLSVPGRIGLQWQSSRKVPRPIDADSLVPPGGNDRYQCPSVTAMATLKRWKDERHENR